MTSSEQLIQAAGNYRIRSQPKWVQELVHDLAHRLEAEHKYTQDVRERAAKEVDEARALLTGPEGSDTFVTLPRTLVGDDETEERPLGRGASIEFRDPGWEPGEGTRVSRFADGSLLVKGYSDLAVVPLSSSSFRIETR
jgi:hypothetical protein